VSSFVAKIVLKWFKIKLKQCYINKRTFLPGSRNRPWTTPSTMTRKSIWKINCP